MVIYVAVIRYFLCGCVSTWSAERNYVRTSIDRIKTDLTHYVKTQHVLQVNVKKYECNTCTIAHKKQLDTTLDVINSQITLNYSIHHQTIPKHTRHSKPHQTTIDYFVFVFISKLFKKY